MRTAATSGCSGSAWAGSRLDGRRTERPIAFSYYKDVAEIARRCSSATDYGPTSPLVIVAVANVASGKVTRLTNVGMATDLNTPQWLDNGHLLIMRVPAKG